MGEVEWVFVLRNRVDDGGEDVAVIGRAMAGVDVYEAAQARHRVAREGVDMLLQRGLGFVFVAGEKAKRPLLLVLAGEQNLLRMVDDLVFLALDPIGVPFAWDDLVHLRFAQTDDDASAIGVGEFDEGLDHVPFEFLRIFVIRIGPVLDGVAGVLEFQEGALPAKARFRRELFQKMVDVALRIDGTENAFRVLCACNFLVHGHLGGVVTATKSL